MEPWHSGETAAQARVGMREKMAKIGQLVVRDHMPEEHRHFFQQQRFLLIAGYDERGHLWASVVHGDVGFVQSLSPTTLQISIKPQHGDPFRFAVGDRLGMLGIEYHSRRRNRLNVEISKVRLASEHSTCDQSTCDHSTRDQSTSDHSPSETTLELKVLQSFGNCPKYIPQRALPELSTAAFGQKCDISSQLSQEQKQWLTSADTFFIASATALTSSQNHIEQQLPNNMGADISHRGGPAGFIDLISERQLRIPDYPGNNFFNTIGNIETNPIVCLLLIDFKNQRCLHIRANAQIIWNSDIYENAPRHLNFSILEVRERR